MPRLALAAALLLALPLAGCIVSVRDNELQPTVGQQLMDLKKAKESGAITDEEYAKARAKVLEQGR